MSIGAVLTGVPAGLAGWKILQNKHPADFRTFSKDTFLQRDIAYLRDKLPTKLTAKSLLDDRRLQEMVLKAYGLDAQIGFNGLMRKVLESDPADSGSTAGRMTDTRFRQISADLNYGGRQTAAVAAVPSNASLRIEWGRDGQGFASFTGSFGTVPLEGVSLGGLGSRQELAEALQAAFRKADGGRADISVKAFGLNLVFSDARGRGGSRFDFSAGAGSAAVAIPGAGSTLPLTQHVALNKLSTSQGFESFTGSFGTVAVEAVPLKGLGDPSSIAAALQAAFREADGGHADISITAEGGSLLFSDARNRHQPQFGFAGAGSARLLTHQDGVPGIAAMGGTKAADSATIEAIVQKYTQARFEQALGETSETLRRAVYARRNLPQVGSWYNIIADRNLAAVVQTALGLPDSFAQLDVDKQKDALSRRMNIADFKNSEKLSKMLERYVAQSSISEARAFASGSGPGSLVQPVPWGGDRFSGASSAALLSILSSR